MFEKLSVSLASSCAFWLPKDSDLHGPTAQLVIAVGANNAATCHFYLVLVIGLARSLQPLAAQNQSGHMQGVLCRS